MNYQEFLKSKEFKLIKTGIEAKDISPVLFEYQKQIVEWACKLGRAAIWADCGLGKTFMQLEWARQINKKTLILTPLAVAQQTILEAQKLDMKVTWWRDSLDGQYTIANYENVEKLPLSEYEAVILDESSILKSFDGKTRTLLIDSFKSTPFKLCCSATPAPNDFMEIGNHAQFLNVLKLDEMLAMFFINDMKTTQKWRLKKHAAQKFWQWIASWAVCLKKPSDLGFDDTDFILPELKYFQHRTESLAQEGQLFVTDAQTLSERLQARRTSISPRAQIVADLINNDTSGDQWLVWCNLNSEADAVRALIPDAVEIRGSDKSEVKANRMLDFSAGKIKVLISKCSISGYGVNWQNCHKMAFLGLSDSYEDFYQATRRCWRFGQKKAVDVHVVISEAEGAVLKNIQRKDTEAGLLYSEMKDYLLKDYNIMQSYKNETNIFEHEKFKMFNGDCVEELAKVETESVGFSIFSPPFASLYTFSSDLRDMSNCTSLSEFFNNFDFFIKELYRVMQSGRLVAVHCMNLLTSKSRDGEIGLIDLRGLIVKAFQDNKFIFASEVTIWKCPIIAMQRTKAIGLLHKQVKKDATISRQGLADYLIVFRKPGENKNPVTHNADELPVQLWSQYASPVWSDINPSDTLQYRSAREDKDERHITPLQLSVIRRALHLWSNPGDLVLSPFAGIGSEGYVSLQHGRRFVGIELKTSYYKQAVNNLLAVADQEQISFDFFRNQAHG